MSAPVLELLPAVDISEGYAVRPVGGTLSGGVASLADLEKLRAMVPSGLEGVVLGKALYAGNFSFEQALKVAGSR